MAAGGGAALAGGGLIAWEHSTWLLSNDVLGGSLVLVGAAIARRRPAGGKRPCSASQDEKQRGAVQVHAAERRRGHAQAITDLEKATAASRGLDGLPADARKLLDDARARAIQARARGARRAPSGGAEFPFALMRLGAGSAGRTIGGRRRGDDVRAGCGRGGRSTSTTTRPRAAALGPGAGVTTSEVARLDPLAAFLEGVASPAHDDFVVRVTSPGGAVAEIRARGRSSLLRLRRAGVRITCCVDRAAQPPHRVAPGRVRRRPLVAAPFAFVGSIGVVAALPNFHRVLTKAEVEPLFTAGKHKRTVTVLGENTAEYKRSPEELTARAARVQRARRGPARARSCRQRRRRRTSAKRRRRAAAALTAGAHVGTLAILRREPSSTTSRPARPAREPGARRPAVDEPRLKQVAARAAWRAATSCWWPPRPGPALAAACSRAPCTRPPPPSQRA